MGVSKRHHVLPIAYLKGWSGGSTHVLVRDLKPSGRETMAVSVKDAAVSKNRNRDVLMENHGFQATHLEDGVLQYLDSEAASLLRRLRETSNFSLTGDEELLIKEFLAHQMTRSDFQLERSEAVIADRHEGGVLDGLDYASEIGPLSLVVSESAGAINEGHVVRHFAFSALMNDVDEHFRNLLPRHVRVYRTEKPLVTCDEPVIPIFESMQSRRQDLCCAPVVIFPLSASSVMMLFHPEMPIRMRDGDMLTASEVNDLNTVIAGNATRFVFGDTTSGEVDRIEVPSSALELHDEVLGGLHLPAPLSDMFDEHRRDLVIGDHGRWEQSEDAPRRPVSRLWPSWHVKTSEVARYITSHRSPKYSMLKPGYVLMKEAS